MRLTTEKTTKILIPNDPDGGYINIRMLSLNELSKIESRCAETAMTESGAKMTVNDHARQNGVAMACMKGWGNFFDEGGKEIEFNAVNMAKVANVSVETENGEVRFFHWVDDEHSKFMDKVKAEEKKAAKN